MNICHGMAHPHILPLAKGAGFDDHRLLPWDGKIDFDRIVGELRDTGYQGILAMEVSYVPYEKDLTPMEFVEKCYDVSCRMAELLD